MAAENNYLNTTPNDCKIQRLSPLFAEIGSSFIELKRWSVPSGWILRENDILEIKRCGFQYALNEYHIGLTYIDEYYENKEKNWSSEDAAELSGPLIVHIAEDCPKDTTERAFKRWEEAKKEAAKLKSSTALSAVERSVCFSMELFYEAVYNWSKPGTMLTILNGLAVAYLDSMNLKRMVKLEKWKRIVTLLTPLVWLRKVLKCVKNQEMHKNFCLHLREEFPKIRKIVAEKLGEPRISVMSNHEYVARSMLTVLFKSVDFEDKYEIQQLVRNACLKGLRKRELVLKKLRCSGIVPERRLESLLASGLGELNDLNTSLISAAALGNVEAVGQLLSSGADVNCVDGDFQTPLHKATMGPYAISESTNMFLDDDDAEMLSIAEKRVPAACAELLLKKGALPGLVDKDGATPLHRAAEHGNLDCLELLIEEVVVKRCESIDCLDDFGMSPMHYAVKIGFPECIKLLVEKGAEVDKRNDGGKTPLHCVVQTAAELGFWDTTGNLKPCIEELLRSGARINAEDNDGRSALHFAVSGFDHPEWAEVLLAKGADKNHQDANGLTALHSALKHGNVLCAEMLLNKGVDVQCKSNDDQTPLHYAAAAAEDVAKCVQLILRSDKGLINDTDRGGETALHKAAQHGNAACAKVLVENGANVKCRNKEGKTPLHVAAGRSADCVDLLLENGAAPLVNCTDRNGLTPLHMATREGNLESAKRLKKNGADINCLDRSGRSPLLYAAMKRDETLLFWLINEDANTEQPDKNGSTLLHYLATPLLTKLALDESENLKKDLHKTDNCGHTPLHMAASAPLRGSRSVVGLFLAEGADIDRKDQADRRPLHFAAGAEKDNVDCLKLVAEEGEKRNSSEIFSCLDKRGRTSLHYAAEQGNEQCLKFLLEKGTLPNCQDKHKQTPLHKAARAGANREACIRILLGGGAQADLKDETGETPLHIAVSASYDEAENVEILLNSGASVDGLNKNMQSALHKAAQHNNLNCIEKLIEKTVSVDLKDAYMRAAFHYAVAVPYGLLGCVEKLIFAHAANCGDYMGLTPLHLAVKQGNVQFANLLIEKGADVDCKDDMLRTPLHYAAMAPWDIADCTRLLIGEDPAVDCVDKNGLTPLHMAVKMGNTACARLLIDQGVKVEADEDTPLLHYAAAAPRDAVDCVKLLLEEGIPATSQDKLKSTPLHEAAKAGNVDCMKVLIEKGALPDCRDSVGRTPLHYAAAAPWDRVDCVEVLLDKNVKISVADDEGFMPVHRAACQGNAETMKYLLGKGAETDVKTCNGDTSLHCAAGSQAWKNVSDAKRLIERGAFPECNDKNGMTALEAAANTGRAVSVELLWETDANTHWLDVDGLVPVHKAIQRDFAECMELLLDRGAPIDSINNCERTALHVAVLCGNDVLVKMLVKRGATKNVIDKDKNTMLHLAVQASHLLNWDEQEKIEDWATPNSHADELISMERGKLSAVMLKEAACAGSENCVQFLITNGVPLKNVNNHGRTAMHYAALYGNIQCLKTLTEENEQEDHVDVADNEGNTALHLATLGDKPTTTEQRNATWPDDADADAEENNWLKKQRKERIECVRFLLDYGASANVKNHEGKTPYDIAQQTLPETVEYFTDPKSLKGSIWLSPVSAGVSQASYS